jgi:hypothetical protein
MTLFCGCDDNDHTLVWFTAAQLIGAWDEMRVDGTPEEIAEAESVMNEILKLYPEDKQRHLATECAISAATDQLKAAVRDLT